jgi:hypothetical protein
MALSWKRSMRIVARRFEAMQNDNIKLCFQCMTAELKYDGRGLKLILDTSSSPDRWYFTNITWPEKCQNARCMSRDKVLTLINDDRYYGIHTGEFMEMERFLLKHIRRIGVCCQLVFWEHAQTPESNEPPLQIVSVITPWRCRHYWLRPNQSNDRLQLPYCRLYSTTERCDLWFNSYFCALVDILVLSTASFCHLFISHHYHRSRSCSRLFYSQNCNYKHNGTRVLRLQDMCAFIVKTRVMPATNNLCCSQLPPNVEKFVRTYPVIF